MAHNAFSHAAQDPARNARQAMGARRYEIVGRIAGEHRDLFCAVTDVHHRRNIFQPLFLGPL